MFLPPIWPARLNVAGFWWAALPRDQWPDDPVFQQSLQQWDDQVGDCRQELVFIGIEMDELELYDSLQACLLTDDEMALGPAVWQEFSDPFPSWEIMEADP